MELSFTRLRIYLECPWKYKLHFIDGKRIAPSPGGALGLSLHRALERFQRAGADSLEDLLDAYAAEWLGSGYADAGQAKEYRRKGQRMLEKWLEAERAERSELVGLEREFVYTLGRHAIRGMIDRINRMPDGKIELVDYKTGAPPSDDLQMRFYALGAKKGLGLAPGLLTIHTLQDGRRRTVPYDAAGEAQLEALILRTADAVEAQAWTPDTRFCPRCDFRDDCAYSVAKGT